MKNIIGKITIVLGLLVLWGVLGLTQVIFIDRSFSILNFGYTSSQIQYSPLRERQLFSGDISSREDYLGIISVYFNPPPKLPRKPLTFKIKERGAKEWYYENDYDIRQIAGLPQHPFGFPIIQHSQGKTYHIEVTYKDSELSQVSVRKKGTILKLSHKFPGYELRSNMNQLALFLKKRLFNIVQYSSGIYAASIFLYPFIFYTLGLLFKKLRNTSQFTIGFYMTLLFLAVYLDIFFILEFIDYAFLLTGLLIFLLYRKYKIKDTFAYLTGLLLLLLSPILSMFNLANEASKSASWSLMLFTIGILLSYYAQFKKSSSR